MLHADTKSTICFMLSDRVIRDRVLRMGPEALVNVMLKRFTFPVGSTPEEVAMRTTYTELREFRDECIAYIEKVVYG